MTQTPCTVGAASAAMLLFAAKAAPTPALETLQ